MPALEADCDAGPAGEALGVATLMAMTWPFVAARLGGTICLCPDVGQDEIAHERRNLARAELAYLVLLNVVQRDLQHVLALQVRFGAHVFLLVVVVQDFGWCWARCCGQLPVRNL